MEDNMGNFSAYDAVESLLLNLEIILLCYVPDLLGFHKRRIRPMYDNLSLMKSLLIDKKLTSSLESRIADTVDRAQSQIAPVVWSLMGLNRATTGTDAGSSAVWNMLFRVSNKDLSFVVYDAVVSLLHELELSLSFDRHTSSDHSLSRFTLEKQSMYNNFSMLDSLLIDSSGQGYDKKLMSGLESLICFVANACLEYIEPQSWWSSIPGRNIVNQPSAIVHFSGIMSYSILDELNSEVEFINENLKDTEHQTSSGVSGASESVNSDFYLITRILELVIKKLRKVRDDRDVLQKSTRSLQDTASTIL